MKKKTVTIICIKKRGTPMRNVSDEKTKKKKKKR